VGNRNIKISVERITTVKNFSSNQAERVQVIIALPARCRSGESRRKIMSRAAPVLLRWILNSVFGLPGIILFGLAGGIALGLVVGRTAKHEIAFVRTATSAGPDAAAWIRSNPAGGRTGAEPAVPQPAFDYLSGLLRFDEVLAYSAGIGEASPLARADQSTRRK
jgi:hypothetical protein